MDRADTRLGIVDHGVDIEAASLFFFDVAMVCAPMSVLRVPSARNDDTDWSSAA